MPANKNAMTRYALIDNMLSNHNRAYSIQDITDVLAKLLPEFGQEPVSKRCVEKDLNYLEYGSPFDVEIEQYWIEAVDKNDRPYRKRCIRYVDPTFSIFKQKLTDDEKTVLAIALDTFRCFDGLANFEWLRGLKQCLKIMEEEPVVILSKGLLTNSSLIARLFSAIKNRQPILLRYHTFSQPVTRSVSLSPYILKEYNNRWFLIASVSDAGRVLTFALDRIEGFDADYRVKYIRTPDNLQERYEEIIGVTFHEESPLQEIIFWISDKSKDYILTKPIHGSQTPIRGNKELQLRQMFPALKGGSLFKIKCRENYELIRELTSYGTELVVLSPANIQESIILRVKGMYNMYNSIEHGMF